MKAKILIFFELCMTDKTLFLILQTALSFAEHCNINAECFCLDLQQHKDRTIYLSMLWCAINRKDTESENAGNSHVLDQARA